VDVTGLLPLRTQRLALRAVRDDDVEAILGYCADPEVTRYLPFDVLDRDGVLGRMTRWRADLARDPADEPDRDWGLTLVADHEGTVVGDVMLRLPAGEVRTLAELGYVFDPAHTGRGLATEAAQALLGLAFDELGCHRVFARLDPRNHASARLCERLGMAHEAHTRQDWWGKGEWADTAVYGILREEWQQRRPG
jgi:aminoglycoside 6'-N-acetyltransferase